MNIKTGFNDSVFEHLRAKVKVITEQDQNVPLQFNEMSINRGMLYNEGKDTVEGFEDFGDMK